MTKEESEKQIKELKKEIQEDKEIKERLMREKADLSDRLSKLKRMIEATCMSMDAEDAELFSRSQRLKLRMLGLGYERPKE